MNELIERANALIKRTPALTLTSIDEEGYPRPVAMAILYADDIHDIWFATPADSQKVAHYKASTKAGATFYADAENVALVGDVEIVTDITIKRKYWTNWIEDFYPGGPENDKIVLLHFKARRAVMVFEGVLSRLSF